PDRRHVRAADHDLASRSWPQRRIQRAAPAPADRISGGKVVRTDPKAPSRPAVDQEIERALDHGALLGAEGGEQARLVRLGGAQHRGGAGASGSGEMDEHAPAVTLIRMAAEKTLPLHAVEH